MIFIGVNETMSYKEEQGLDKQFNAEEIEKRCDAYWSANEVYKYDATQSRDNSFVIDFAAALYGLGKKEAAVQLAQDFGLSYEDWKPPGKAKKPKPRQKSPEEQFQEAKNRCFRILADYLHLLRVWRKEYAPHSPEEVFHPRFVEALQKQDHVEYLLDVLLFGETEEKAALITEYGKDVIQLEQRMAELAAADAARTKKHHERYAAAPEH